MKVAFFIAEYRSFAGSQRGLLDTIQAWRQEGGEAIALFPGEGLCSQMYRQKGIPTLILPAPPSLHRFQRQLLRLPTAQKLRIWLTEILPYSWRVGRVLREQGCRLLHVNSSRGNLISSWIPRWMGFPIVFHLHGKQVVRGLLWDLAQRLAHRIVLVAHHLKSEVSPSYYTKIRILYNAVSPSEIEQLSLASLDSLSLPQDSRPLIVSFASLVPGKGVHHLVRAASLVVKEYPALFVVAGGTPDVKYSEYVKKLAQDLCPHHFLFTGYLTNPYPLLRQAQVIVLPTIMVPEEVPTDNPIAVPVGEGLPRSFLEAMAIGKPIVGTRIEGASEALGEAGYLVPPADPEAMASAILEVLKSPSLREQMGQKGRQRVQELFSLERHRKMLSDIYAELLKV